MDSRNVTESEGRERGGMIWNKGPLVLKVLGRPDMCTFKKNHDLTYILGALIKYIAK